MTRRTTTAAVWGLVAPAVAAGLTASAWGQPVDDAPARPPAASPRDIIDRLIADPPAAAVVEPVRNGGSWGESGTMTGADPGERAIVPDAIAPEAVRVDHNAPLPRLRREGGFVVNRPGRFFALPAAAGGEALWVFAFDPQAGVDDLRPMIVQRTQRLQLMQDAEAANATEVEFTGDTTARGGQRGRLVGRFRVSGQVHLHRGVNYLLPTAVQTLGAIDVRGASRPPADGGNPPATTGDQVGGPVGTGAAADRFDEPVIGGPARSGGGATFTGPDDPRRVMDTLLSRPDAANLIPRTAARVPPAGAVAEGLRDGGPDDDTAVTAPRIEGSYLIRRNGRPVRGNDGSLKFAFTADGPDGPEPPVNLMPCRLTEELEDLLNAANTGWTAATTPAGPEIELSARVYAYRGVNHVLPTAYRFTASRDNLGR